MRKKPTIPFVGLHAHDGFSVGDGLGYPSEHYNFAYENGLQAHAITNHGHMNSVPHVVLHTKKMQEEGRNIKPIYGVEAYFVPCLKEWEAEYEKAKEDKKRAKALAKNDRSGTFIENEEETQKSKNIINRRRHLVLLAQNQEGLNDLYEMVSESYGELNFYRYPRVDYAMLRKYGKNLIASSACLTADALLDTDKGPETLGSVITRLKNGEEVFALSYNIEEGKIVYQQVVWGDLTRKQAKIVKIKLKNGKTLRLTPDHKVYTNEGWMEAQDLSKHKGIKILSLK